MTPTDRKILLLRANVKQADIARDLNISQATVYKIIHDQKTSRRVRDAVARALDLPIEELWPQAKKAA